MSLIPIDEVVYFDVVTHNPGTGAITDADSTPTFDVFEEATDTPILSAQSFTKRTSLTGDYRGTFTASAANGFEAGKWYNVLAYATVTNTVSSTAISAKTVAMRFRVAPSEASAGVPKVDASGFAVASVAGAVGSVTGAVGSVTGAVGSVTAGVTVTTNNDKTGYALTAGERTSIADAHLDRSDGIETGLTPRQAHRLEAAAAAGKLSGAATSSVVIRNAVADSKDRVTATVDADGNRTAVTTDVT